MAKRLKSKMTSLNRRKSITINKYSEKMDKIIAKGGAVNKTLIALLNEANKYTIKGMKPKKCRKIVAKIETKSQNHTRKGAKCTLTNPMLKEQNDNKKM
jgi:hypothetical protein